MAKKTTLKPIGLGFRTVGASSGDYTKFMGVLKGLTIAQDEPESTEIEAEFYDAPFDIFYQGNPVTMTFELANYDLSELPAICTHHRKRVEARLRTWFRFVGHLQGSYRWYYQEGC